MRPLIVVIGIVLIIVGVVLLEVPFVAHGTKTVTETTPATFHVGEEVPILQEPISASWTSATSVTIVARTCSSLDSSASSIWGQCTGGSNQTVTGKSGSFSPSVPIGGYLWVVLVPTGIGPANASASVGISTSLPSGALGLWGLGGIIVIAGVLLHRRKRAVPPEEGPPAAALQTPETEPNVMEAVAPTGSLEGPDEENPADEPLD